jgi:hypothetical protein
MIGKEADLHKSDKFLTYIEKRVVTLQESLGIGNPPAKMQEIENQLL